MSAAFDATGSDDTPAPASRPASPLFAVEGAELVAPLTLAFVRHGVTAMTVSHAFSGGGVPGPSLSAAGKVQAAKAADAVYRMGRSSWGSIATVTRVMASPMVRTQETAAALGRRLGLKVETVDALKEADFGEWESLRSEDIAATQGHAIHRWRFGQIAAPGGESMSDVGARLDAVIRDLAADHARLAASGDDVPRTWAAVSHAVAIKCAVGISMGMDARLWGSVWPLPASLTVLQLRVTAGGEIAERHLMCLGAPTD